MKKLYYVINEGCDASTYGIIELSEEELDGMMQFIRNLNQNSWYGCMPTISLHEISWDDLKEVTIRKDVECDDDEYVDPDNRFFYNGKVYTWKHDFSYAAECLPKIP